MWRTLLVATLLFCSYGNLAAAQCTVHANDVLLDDLLLPTGMTIDLAWVDALSVTLSLERPLGTTAPVHLLRPIDADARAPITLGLSDGTPFDAMFFDGVTPALAHEARVLPSAGGARVRVGRLRFGQLIVSCASLRLVAAGDGVSALPEWSGDAEHRELRRSVSFRAAPDAHARAIQIAPDASDTVLLSTIATQGPWVHVAADLGQGARVHGWVRASEVPVSDSGQGAGGFSGRRARAPRTSVPSFACYVGPAHFPARTPLYAVENGARPWGAVAADERLVIRDCHSSSRVQLAEALGGENLGWVDATAVHDVGVSECEGLTLAQDTRTLRVRITASTRTDVVPGDEVVRVGSRAVYGPPFDSARRGMVSPMALRDVCSGLARERVVLDRGGRRVVLPEPVPMP